MAYCFLREFSFQLLYESAIINYINNNQNKYQLLNLYSRNHLISKLLYRLIIYFISITSRSIFFLQKIAAWKNNNYRENIASKWEIVSNEKKATYIRITWVLETSITLNHFMACRYYKLFKNKYIICNRIKFWHKKIVLTLGFSAFKSGGY